MKIEKEGVFTNNTNNFVILMKGVPANTHILFMLVVKLELKKRKIKYQRISTLWWAPSFSSLILASFYQIRTRSEIGGFLKNLN